MPSSDAGSRPVGAHVRTAGGLVRGALAYADACGAEVLQLFVTNPRSWRLAPGDPADDRAFRAAVTTAGRPVFVHASYLVNLGSPRPDIVDRSVETVAHALVRGRTIGASGVVVHTGSASGGQPRDAALRQVRERLLPVLALLDELADHSHEPVPHLLLEPSAGQGGSLVSTADELAPYLDALDRHPRVGVCLDTCHAFAAGHDLTAPDGADRLLRALEAATGPGRLALVHANDSAAGCGSHLDRHAVVGTGLLGPEPFRALLHHPLTSGVPFVVETPGHEPEHAVELDLLRRLRDEPAAPWVRPRRSAARPGSPPAARAGRRRRAAPGSAASGR